MLSKLVFSDKFQLLNKTYTQVMVFILFHYYLTLWIHYLAKINNLSGNACFKNVINDHLSG